MTKREKKQILWSGALCLVPIAFGVSVYDQLPERIATHFDFSGVANGWSSRPMTVFGIPLFLLAVHLCCVLATLKEQRVAQASPILHKGMLWFIPVLSLVTNGSILGTALGWELSVERYIPTLVGVLFVYIGNYLPKTKQNAVIGVKIPWTLKSEENWNRTHRLTGFLWVVVGLCFILLSCLNRWNGVLFGILLSIMVLLPVLYSYRLHRKGI